MVSIRKVTLPLDGLDALTAESVAQGYEFLLRLQAEWDSGANRFDGPGEGLFGAFDGPTVIAIGGLNRDPFSPNPAPNPAPDAAVGRIRRVYVLSASRGSGVGTQLVQTLLAEARLHFRQVRLRAVSPAAARFYERLGFRPIADPDATHLFSW